MSTTQVTDAEATIQTGDGPMPVHVAVPSGPPRGAVVVVQEAFGLTGHIRDVTRRFAAAGWHALAPALYHREGAPVFDETRFEEARGAMQTLNAGGLTMDVEASLEELSSAGFSDEHLAVVGFCMGGAIAFYAATLRPLGAAVTFYGGGVTQGRFGLPALVDLAPSIKTPWLGLYGDRDQGIPPDDVERLRGALGDVTVDTEIVRYPDAGHGFHNDERPDAFVAPAAQDAWARTLGWLERHAEADAPGR